jgi:hypothetical protein
MKKLLIAFLSTSLMVTSLNCGFGKSFGGSFLGATTANILTQPRAVVVERGDSYEHSSNRRLHNKIEELKDENRELTSENKDLRKELKELRKLLDNK